MRSTHRWFLLAALSGLIFGLAALLDLTPWLRGPVEWRWALTPPRPAAAVLLFGAALLVFLGGWWLMRAWATAPTRWRPAFALTALFALALLVQVANLRLYRDAASQILFERLLSNQASGYFTVAQEIEHWPTALREYDTRMPAFRPDPHPRSKPPGIVLSYMAQESIVARFPDMAATMGPTLRLVRCADLWVARLSDVALTTNWLMGWLIVLASTASIIPAYYLVRSRAGAQAGWLAAGLVALLPGRLAFAPQMDTVYPLLGLLALWAVDIGVRRRGPGWLFLAGLILSLATFFSLVNALLAILAGLYLLFLLWERDGFRLANLGRADYLASGGLLLLGTLSIWLVYWLWAGMTPWAIYVAAGPARHDLARNYWLWLPGNFYDLAIFAGLPVMLLALRRPEPQPGQRPLYIAFWLLLGLMLVSGTIRGEVGRIWFFLAPLPALLVAWQKLPARAGLALVALLALSTLAIGWRWEVTQLEWPDPVARPVTRAANPAERVNLTFGAGISLLGYDLAANGAIELQLYWQVAERPDRPYTVFVHLLDESGQIIGQQDQMPQNGLLPTTCWLPGEVVADTHRLPLTEVTTPVSAIRTGLYDAVEGAPLGSLLIELP